MKKTDGRLFISVDLRQWIAGAHAVEFEDAAGNVVTLDGLSQGAPHTHVLIELDVSGDSVPRIKIPGWHTDYDKTNAFAVREGNPRRNPPARRVEMNAAGKLVPLTAGAKDLQGNVIPAPESGTATDGELGVAKTNAAPVGSDA